MEEKIHSKSQSKITPPHSSSHPSNLLSPPLYIIQTPCSPIFPPHFNKFPPSPSPLTMHFKSPRRKISLVRASQWIQQPVVGVQERGFNGCHSQSNPNCSPNLDHHAVALGSCPKFRVSSPNDLRFSVWNHSIDLLRNRRYASMADFIDISSLVSDSIVKVIDFRAFVSGWCGLSIDAVCSDSEEFTLSEELRKCGLLLSGYNDGVNDCVYDVEDDCRTTVWTYQEDGEDGALDLFQPDEQLKKKKKFSFVRRRRDVYKALGPGSEAESAAVLVLGSLFTAPYRGSESHFDIHETRKDRRIQSVIEKIEFLPFVPEILKAGKEIAQQKIKAPFLCAQLRLLDGQFKNHWKATFLALKEKLESLKQKGPLPIHVFVMTDLPVSNWIGTYLGDLVKSSGAFKLSVLREDNGLVVETAKKLMDFGWGKSFGYVSSILDIEKQCEPQVFPDILLFIEETVCSCASLGFVGTAGSTIAESIELMRKYSICSG